MVQSVNVKQLRENLSAYLSTAASGTEILVTSHGKPLARIVPVDAKRPRREARGALRGQVVIADDFDRLPDDVLDAMEGRQS